MPTHVALLRAVNVAGHGKIAMADLRQLAGAIGLGRPATILNSGNLLFDAPAGAKEASLEAQIETALRDRFGLGTEVPIRKAADWAALVAGNPFLEAAKQDPAHLVLMVLKGEPREGAEDELRNRITGPERLAVLGRGAYIVYPDGIAGSKLTLSLLDRLLGTRGTGRNWNTALRIAAALGTAPAA